MGLHDSKLIYFLPNAQIKKSMKDKVVPTQFYFQITGTDDVPVASSRRLKF